MTNKELSLRKLNSSTAQYNSWLTNIKMLCNGLQVDESEIRVNPTTCPLYIWLTEDLHNISFGNRESVHNYIKDILDIHSQNFLDYDKIRNIYFPKQSTLSKIFISNKVSEKDKEIVKIFEVNIVENSKKMIEKIERIASQLQMAHENKFLSKDEITDEIIEENINEKSETKDDEDTPRYYRGQRIN